MARLKDLAKSTRDGFNIDPRKIEVEAGFNARDFSTEKNVAKLAELKASIRENGVLVPLTVQLAGERVVLRDGETRWRAVMALIGDGVEIKTVPCQSEDRNAAEDMRVLRMLVRNQSNPLDPLEQADGFRRLLAFGWTEAQIATKSGYSATHISNCLTLGAAPVEVQNFVKAGKVSASGARSVLRREGENAAPVLRAAVASAERAGKHRAGAREIAAQTGRPHLTPFQVDDLFETMRRLAETMPAARACLSRIGIALPEVAQAAE